MRFIYYGVYRIPVVSRSTQSDTSYNIIVERNTAILTRSVNSMGGGKKRGKPSYLLIVYCSTSLKLTTKIIIEEYECYTYVYNPPKEHSRTRDVRIDIFHYSRTDRSETRCSNYCDSSC